MFSVCARYMHRLMEMDKSFVKKYRLAKHNRPNGIPSDHCTLTRSVQQLLSRKLYTTISCTSLIPTPWYYYVVVASICDWPDENCSSRYIHLITGNRPSDHNRVAPSGRQRQPVSQKNARNNATGMTDRSNLFRFNVTYVCTVNII